MAKIATLLMMPFLKEVSILKVFLVPFKLDPTRFKIRWPL